MSQCCEGYERGMNRLDKKIDDLQSENERLKSDLSIVRESHKRQGELNDRLSERLKEAHNVILRASQADCPRYVAHPQSVWWQIHCRDILRDYLKDGKNGK